MLVLKDIEHLQLSSFQDCVSRFLPTAKHIYIIYGIQWITLFEVPRVDGVRFQWYCEHGEAWKRAFAEAIDAAETQDILIFIDPDTLSKEEKFAQYRNTWEKLEKLPRVLTADVPNDLD